MKTFALKPRRPSRWQQTRKFIGRWWPQPFTAADPSTNRYVYGPIALGTQTLPCVVVLKPKQSTNDFYDQWEDR